MSAVAHRTPEEILALAIAIEEANAQRYREWAHRFRPFDAEVAALLNELAREEHRHRTQLAGHFNARFQAEPPPVCREAVREHLVELPDDDRHFFVVNSSMAQRILETALAAERRTQRFYESLLERCADPMLSEVCEPLAAFEAEHVSRILDRLDSFAAP